MSISNRGQKRSIPVSNLTMVRYCDIDLDRHLETLSELGESFSQYLIIVRSPKCNTDCHSNRPTKQSYLADRYVLVYSYLCYIIHTCTDDVLLSM